MSDDGWNYYQAVESHRRITELEQERDMLREALRRMVARVGALPRGRDEDHDSYEAAMELAGLGFQHPGYRGPRDSAERGLASIRAAVEARRSGT